MPDSVTDPTLRARLDEIKDRIETGLARLDPHHRLTGRPVTYRVISGQTFEVTYKEVPQIDESEVLGFKKLVGETCFCSVHPQTAENLTVRFVIPLG